MADHRLWEYNRLVEDVSGLADVQGTIDEHMFDLIQAGGKEGWELISAQSGTRPDQHASNRQIPVIVLLFKREYFAPRAPQRPFEAAVGGSREIPKPR